MDEFNTMFPISDSSADGVGMITPFQKTRKTGYFEARTVYAGATKLKYAMGNLTATGDAGVTTLPPTPPHAPPPLRLSLTRGHWWGAPTPLS